LIAYLLDWALFSALTVQLYFYYEAFPNERWTTKGLVYTIYCIELVQIIFSTLDAFVIFGSGFGEVSALAQIHFAWLTSPILTALVSFIVQSFYAYRLYILSRSRIIVPILIAKKNPLIISEVWLCGSAVVDITIAACMSYYASFLFLVVDAISSVFQLTTRDTGFRQTHTVLSRIMRLTIETGSLTAAVALTTFILFMVFPDKIYYTTPATFVPTLYANAMLTVLNARSQILGGRSTQNSFAVSNPSYLR
ncbi:hypothetical protein B0H19DRAFT_846325, partial [Mycena capillaripes]